MIIEAYLCRKKMDKNLHDAEGMDVFPASTN